MAMTMLHTPCIEYRIGVSDYTLSPCNIHNNKYNKCLMLLLFVSIIVCRFEWMLDDGWKNGDTDRQTNGWTFRTDIPICNRANMWGVTKHSELDVQCWGLSTCPLWSLDTVFFYRKSRRFLVFFCLLFIATIFRVLLPLRFCFRCESLIFISLLCHQSSE